MIRIAYFVCFHMKPAVTSPIHARNTTMTGILIRAFAASSVGGFESFAGAGIGALVLGVAEALARLLRWRLAVLARHPDAGLGARLLEEGIRTELGMPPADADPHWGMVKHARRRLGSQAARVIYRLWRSRRSRP